MLLPTQCKRKNLEEDDMPLLLFVLSLKEKKKLQEEGDDNCTFLNLLRSWVQDQAQKKQKKKKKKKGTKKGKKKKKHCKEKQTEKKFWQRWRKRLSYMEELGEVEGNRLYMDEHAQKAMEWRLNKRKREELHGKKQKKKQESKKKNQKKKYII